jgi:hypothetical protein
MKLLIVLKEEYLDLTGKKKITQAEVQKLHDALCAKAIKEFKQAVKEWLADKTIQIVKEYVSNAWVIIQFKEEARQQVYDKFRTIDVVDVMDTILPKN